MSYNKSYLLGKAAEIVIAYAQGGGKVSLDIVLRNVYEEVKKINNELGE